MKRQADRETTKALLKDALEAISLAQDLVSDVRETGHHHDRLGQALDALYEAHTIVGDSIPRGK